MTDDRRIVTVPRHNPINAISEPDNLIVVDSLAGEIATDLAPVNPPATQSRALTLEDVLVENDHTETDLLR
jgi:hypothetical protein